MNEVYLRVRGLDLTTLWHDEAAHEFREDH